MIIPDTSVWIEFLKSNEPHYSDLLTYVEKNETIVLSFIFGELLQGIKNKRESKIILEYWQNLPKIDESQLWIDAGIYSAKHNLLAKGIGLIDAAIIVASLKTGYKIITLDKRLNKAINSET